MGYITRQAFVRSEFKGPIPHPDILAGYESTCPGAADRVIAMAEKAQNHMHSLEQRAADYLDREQANDATDRRWGMLCAFILAAGTLVGAGLMLYTDHPIGAAGFGVSGAAMLAKLFLGRTSNGKTDEQQGENPGKDLARGDAGRSKKPPSPKPRKK